MKPQKKKNENTDNINYVTDQMNYIKSLKIPNHRYNNQVNISQYK